MAGLEENIDILIRRRNLQGNLDHNLVREIILRDIFQEVNVVPPRLAFDLEEIEEEVVQINFRFGKEDLRVPDVIRTRTGHTATGIEGMCILLRRFAYPNRLSDLQHIFQRSTAALSEICNFLNMHIYGNFRHLLEDLGNLNWLNQQRLQLYSEAIAAKGAAVGNCWASIDGTARAICRPCDQQEEYYYGHKHFHCVKYQSVVCPDGITVSEIGAFAGRRHDAVMFRESGLYDQLERYARFPDGTYFVLYGDQAYGIRELLLCPFPENGVNEAQQNFNASMSIVRQAVEWSFQKIISLFAFLDFKKNQKLLLQDIEQMYQTAIILTNCHTCLYGSQTAQFFNIEPCCVGRISKF